MDGGRDDEEREEGEGDLVGRSYRLVLEVVVEVEYVTEDLVVHVTDDGHSTDAGFLVQTRTFPKPNRGRK